jgi:hypothetical protein
MALEEKPAESAANGVGAELVLLALIIPFSL